MHMPMYFVTFGNSNDDQKSYIQKCKLYALEVIGFLANTQEKAFSKPSLISTTWDIQTKINIFSSQRLHKDCISRLKCIFFD